MDPREQMRRLERRYNVAAAEVLPVTSRLVTQVGKKEKRLWKWLKRNKHKVREPVFFFLWIFWLFVGTLFYAYYPGSISDSDTQCDGDLCRGVGLGIVKGFYMAINIGYSIGFGYPSEVASSHLMFSCIYVLVGASFVGVALGFFAKKITTSSDSWFSRLQQKKKIEEAIRLRDETFQGKIQAWIFHNSSALKAVSVWLTFILIMICYSMVSVQWPFIQALYFAVSTLSTGGHWSIPDDSPTWLFGLTGFFTMLGVPVMALAMAEVATGIISQGAFDEARATIEAVVTKDELELLQDLGLENFDGEVDKAAFVILCMVRMGTDPGLIQFITQRFAELNFLTGNPLTVAEITQGACRFVDGRIRNRLSVQQPNVETVEEHQQHVPEASTSYLDYFHGSGFRKKMNQPTLTNHCNYKVDRMELQRDRTRRKSSIRQTSNEGMSDESITDQFTSYRRNSSMDASNESHATSRGSGPSTMNEESVDLSITDHFSSLKIKPSMDVSSQSNVSSLGNIPPTIQEEALHESDTSRRSSAMAHAHSSGQLEASARYRQSENSNIHDLTIPGHRQMKQDRQTDFEESPCDYSVNNNLGKKGQTMECSVASLDNMEKGQSSNHYFESEQQYSKSQDLSSEPTIYRERERATGDSETGKIVSGKNKEQSANANFLQRIVESFKQECNEPAMENEKKWGQSGQLQHTKSP